MNENKIRSAITENPLLVLFLGACPAMGASGNVIAALGMGGAVLVIMLLSTLAASALRGSISGRGGMPALVLIIAGFASLVQLLMNAFLPSVYQMLGVYLTVAAVSLLTFAQAEDGGERGLGAAVGGSLLTAVKFALAMLAMALVRELFGAGSLAGIEIPFFKTYNIPILTQPSGGFFVLSLLAALLSKPGQAAAKAPRTVAAAAAGLSAPDEMEEE